MRRVMLVFIKEIHVNDNSLKTCEGWHSKMGLNYLLTNEW